MLEEKINRLSVGIVSEKEEYFKLKGRMENLLEHKQELIRKKEELKSKDECLQKVKYLLQNASQFAREQSKKQMEYLVTQCLQYVFGDKMEFKIEILERSNRIEAEFYVVSKMNDRQVTTRPQDSHGGGVVDVISLALRSSMMEIHNPKIEGPIVLDEPAKHVSNDFIENVGDFLKQISTVFNRQIIIVTHNNHLLEQADIAFKVYLKDGISIVEPLNLT